MTDKNCKTCAIKKYFIPEIIIVLAVLALDIFLKKYSEKYLINNPKVFIPGVINLVYVENRGAAFGIFQNALAFFIILTIIALAAFIFFLYKKRDGHFLLRLALVLIISGTAGNFIDRVKAGYVIDMIELQFMEFAVFNIADSALTVGTVLFAIYYLFIYKEPEKEPVKQTPEAITGDDINNE